MGRVGFRKQILSVDSRRSVRDVLRQIFGQSCFASVDNDFGLSEGDRSDQEGVGISLYLWGTIIDLNIALSMNRVVALEQPSNVTILSILMKDEEDTSEEESSLIVSVS